MGLMRHSDLQNKEYLGDGVYVGHDGYHVIIYLEDEGVYGRNSIALEPSVLIALENYTKKVRALPK